MRPSLAPLVLAALAATGCAQRAEPTDGDAGPPPWATSSAVPTPRAGMVWIPPGELIAGTPPGKEPRVADAEMTGERVTLGGFWIDDFIHPNEAGALPVTGVSRQEAIALCEGAKKRLCSELELERACKGPENAIHPWGETYRASPCGTGTKRAGALPNGYFAGCTSGYGVHDPIGNVWSWTSSDWGRGTEPGWVAVRGGGGSPGELVGRCAHAERVRPDARRPDLGVRCCDGPANEARVVLEVDRGQPLVLHQEDGEAERFLETLVADGAPEEGPLAGGAPSRPAAADGPRFDVEHVWTWRPLGNEELRLGGGCDRTVRPKRCGLVVARPEGGSLKPLAFAATDRWTPTLSVADGARVLSVYGGDRAGAFRKRLAYDWGRIAIGTEKERKKKRKGKKPGWD